jgi:hypothetical protein
MGSRPALKNLLDQIDPAARSVSLVTEQAVRRTGGVAETAMDARAEDRLGFGTVASVPDLLG